MWARNPGWLFSSKAILIFYSSQQLKTNSHSQKEVYFAQRQVGAPCRWTAAEAAAGTDGKSCYECNADPWEMILHILQHNQVTLMWQVTWQIKFFKRLVKRSRTKLELRCEAACDWYSEVIFFFSFISFWRSMKTVITVGPDDWLGALS